MITTVNVEGIGDVEITFTERGAGQPVVLLHGGAGPLSVVPWAEQLAGSKPARVITPTHPGFMGTPRPGALTDVAGLARVHAALIRELAPDGATVIGNSIGGWIAAELALLAPTLVKKLVLVDAVGIEVPGHPVADVFTLSLEELSRLSYHDPQRFRVDPSKLTPQQTAMFGANRAALKVYGSHPMDPGLRPRLATMTLPTLVVWGEADRIADGDYGRAFATAIPNARFQMLAGTGHVPQIETPQLLAEAIWPFIAD
jgi:pimeloyl-ACP methyl ester carboxylesterase